MALGLGSGRALWRVVELIGDRWPGGAPIRAAVASDATFQHPQLKGIEVIQLDGSLEPTWPWTGPTRSMLVRVLKGGGGALLREKIVVSAARRFVVVAEASKLVDRLGQSFKLPVEVVRFGWEDTRRRLSPLVTDMERVLTETSPT